jgi:hypothetical protein
VPGLVAWRDRESEPAKQLTRLGFAHGILVASQVGHPQQDSQVGPDLPVVKTRSPHRKPDIGEAGVELQGKAGIEVQAAIALSLQESLFHFILLAGVS